MQEDEAEDEVQEDVWICNCSATGHLTVRTYILLQAILLKIRIS
jgi:hypothetical protein